MTNMKKVDVHVHSKGSQQVIRGSNATRKLGVKESYVDFEHQYRLAKKRGMDYVTLSDHNSISEAMKLVEAHPKDTFMSCEYLIKGRPEGQDLEILVLDIDQQMHCSLMNATEYGAKAFVDLVRQADRPFSLAHPAWAVQPKPRLTVNELEEWVGMCDVIEGLNGDCQRENEVAQIIAKYKGKPMSGGSDDHGGLHTGLTYTVAPEASSKEEFLQHFKEGKIHSEGEGGSIRKFYREIMSIGRGYLASEKVKIKSLGIRKYAELYPDRFLKGLIVKPMLPFILMLTARFSKEAYEMRCKDLEDAYIRHIKQGHEKLIQEVIGNLEKKLENNIESLESMVKSPEAYIPTYSFIERIIKYFLGKKDYVYTDFTDRNSRSR